MLSATLRLRGRFWLIVVHDLLVIALSFPLALLLRQLDNERWLDGMTAVALQGAAVSAALGVVIFGCLGLWRSFWRYTSPEQLFAVLKAVSLLEPLLCLALFVIGSLPQLPRSIPFIQWLLLLAMLLGSRLLYASMVASWRLRRARVPAPAWEPLLLVGFGEGAALLIQMLRARRLSSLEAVGLLDDRPGHQGRMLYDVPVLGTLDDLDNVLARLEMRGIRPRRLVLAGEASGIEAARLDHLYAAADRLGIAVLPLAALMRLSDVDRAGGQDEPGRLEAMDRHAVGTMLSVKRVTDLTLICLALPLLLPLSLLLAVLVWIEMGRPILFDQVRPGRTLHNFTLYKFRTLHDGISADGRPLPDQARMSRIGAWLRRTRLDELPQLWNVLGGEMSLVGPRPLLPRDLPSLGGKLHERFAVRPGITGWAQVNGGHQLSSEQKLALDLWYIRHWSPWLDLKIIAMTFWMMIVGEKIGRRAIERAAI